MSEEVDKIPESVKEAAEEADRLQRELIEANKAQKTDQGEPPKTDQPEPEVAPEETPKEEPEPEEPSQEPPEEVKSVEPKPEGDAQPTKGEPAKREDYEHKYKVLQGMYNKDTTELRTAIKTLEARSRGMEGLLSQIQAKEQVAAQPKAEPAYEYLNPEEFKDYDPEVKKLIEQHNRLASYVAYLDGAVKERTGQIEGRVKEVHIRSQEDALNRFKTDLAGVEPDWKTVDADPAWRSWLSQPDDLSGVPRGEFLKRAVSNHDVARVSRFISTWRKETGRPRPQTAQATPNQQRRPNIEKLLVPNRVSADSMPKSKKSWTRSDISKFYQEKADGKWDRREDEARKIERDIFAATKEGRLTA